MQNVEMRWQDVGISNNFIFIHVLQNKSLASKFLKLITHIEIVDIDTPKPEKYFDSFIDAKSIKSDIYISDKNIYNIECQVKNEKKDPLNLRQRFIHSTLSVNSLDKGKKYEKLQNNFVIFICKYDYFNCGFPVYEFNNKKCEKHENIELNDLTHTIILNSTYKYKDGVDPDLLGFLDYFNGSEPKSEIAKETSDEVQRVKSKNTIKEQFMNLSMMIRDAEVNAYDDGYNSGFDSGSKNTKI